MDQRWDRHFFRLLNSEGSIGHQQKTSPLPFPNGSLDTEVHVKPGTRESKRWMPHTSCHSVDSAVSSSHCSPGHRMFIGISQFYHPVYFHRNHFLVTMSWRPKVEERGRQTFWSGDITLVMVTCVPPCLFLSSTFSGGLCAIRCCDWVHGMLLSSTWMVSAQQSKEFS